MLWNAGYRVFSNFFIAIHVILLEVAAAAAENKTIVLYTTVLSCSNCGASNWIILDFLQSHFLHLFRGKLCMSQV